MTFSALSELKRFRHRFTLRNPSIDVNERRELVIERLWDWHRDHVLQMGFDKEGLRTAEQVHGNQVTVLRAAKEFVKAPACDGLVTNLRGITLGIYVADCCAVFLADPRTGAFGIVHSGKKGTEGRIVHHAIHALSDNYGSDPRDVVVQLSPCIRPPAYEIDFAASIRQQSLEAGVLPGHLHDTGICTSTNLTTFYSYRMEKGKTGRMLALLGRWD
ncbi:MAG: polyphenol oxidase family protein [Verrucomicrobiaceae bacterium]|nr:polyphenol oxidase family protein [Verrucomicrobiaceae bacterium]